MLILQPTTTRVHSQRIGLSSDRRNWQARRRLSPPLIPHHTVCLLRPTQSLTGGDPQILQHFRSWHKTDIASGRLNVRCWAKSRHPAGKSRCPLMTQFGRRCSEIKVVTALLLAAMRIRHIAKRGTKWCRLRVQQDVVQVDPVDRGIRQRPSLDFLLPSPPLRQ